MDFHSLTRKELQALCKKNKIPANVTNVAMADALAALDTVEGLEEFLNPTHSPEKAVPESPLVPRSVTRTSTRRKPVKEELENAEPTTRTRRTVRSVMDQDLDQENDNVNLIKTPAVPANRRWAPAASASKKTENEGLVKTPAVQTGRRRTQAVSERKKLEEGSVQPVVYSTRRSVRLLEKSMADLSLKEPVKMGVLDETEEKDVSGNLEKANHSSSGESFIDVQEKDKSDDNGVDVSDMGTQISVDLDEIERKDESGHLEKTNHSSSGESFIDVQEKDKSDDNGVDVSDMSTQISVSLDETKGIDASGHLEKTSHSSSGDSFIYVQEKDKSDDNGVDVSDMDTQIADNLDYVSNLDAEDDSKDETSEMGPVDVPVTEFTYETEQPSANVYDDISVKDHEADKLGDAYVLVSESLPESENDFVEVMVPEDVSLKADQKDVEVFPEQENMELPFDSDSWDSDSDISVNESMDSQKSVSDRDIEEEVQCFEKEIIKSDNVEEQHGSETSNVEMEESDSEGLVDVNCTVGEVVMISYDDNSPISTSEVTSTSEDKAVGHTEDPVSAMNNLIDVPVMPAEEVDLASNLPPLPETPPSDKQMSPFHRMSALETDKIATQFPRPTQLTPMKSSSKKQTTKDQKPTLAIHNNENIDTSGIKVEPKKDEMKKKTTISLNDMSLRQLNKMFKEQAKIHNRKNSDDEQFATKTQMGKTSRPALQKLAENVMHPET